MESNKVLLVITANVNKQNIAELPEYLGAVMQIFVQNGGKPVGRYKTVHSLMGEDSPEMMAIVAFDDAQTIKDLVSGEAFQGLADLRERVFSKLNMLISETI